MPNRHIRKALRDGSPPAQFHILVLEQDEHFAHTLKSEIESQLHVNVVVVHTIESARLVLSEQPHTFFLGITSVLNLDTDAFEKVDLLGEFNIPIIAIVSKYED